MDAKSWRADELTINIITGEKKMTTKLTELEGNPKSKGAGMSEQINKSTQAWLKEIGAESPDAELKNRIAELERQVQEYKEENVKLLQTLLALHRAVKRVNVELDKIEESCDNNVWFQKIKERTY